jgi:hypothetical protein
MREKGVGPMNEAAGTRSFENRNTFFDPYSGLGSVCMQRGKHQALLVVVLL